MCNKYYIFLYICNLFKRMLHVQYTKKKKTYLKLIFCPEFFIGPLKSGEFSLEVL